MSKKKKITLLAHPKRVIKKNKDGLEEDITGLICAYIFLLSSFLLLVQVLDNFKFTIVDMDTTYKVILLPIVFFIVNVITKKFGFKIATKAIVISALAGYLISLIFNIPIANKINIFITFGDLLGFIVSMFINLSIYYYLLINTKMTTIPIILTYTFSLLINNLTSMLFKYNMIYSSYFWQEYLLLIMIQLVIIIPLSLIDNEVKRGI